MRNRIGRWRTVAAAFAVAALVGTTACGGGDNTPHEGQALMLADWPLGQPGRPAGLAPEVRSALLGLGTPAGIAYGSDGRLYALGRDLVRFDDDRTIHVVNGRAAPLGDDEIYGGLVAEPGGTFLTGRGAELQRWRPGGTTQVVAAFTAADRHVPSAVPASAPVGAVHTTGVPRPVGVRPDGSVVLVDSDVVWSLKDGRLTRLFQAAPSGDKDHPAGVLLSSAVSRSGTVWLGDDRGDLFPRLSGLRTVAPDGTVARPALPARVAGVPEDPAALTVIWLADDGADGVYANAHGQKGSYVLHLRPGSAVAVARTLYEGSTASCDVWHPVDAMTMTCDLPRAVAHRTGRLAMVGSADRLLTVVLAGR